MATQSWLMLRIVGRIFLGAHQSFMLQLLTFFLSVFLQVYFCKELCSSMFKSLIQTEPPSHLTMRGLTRVDEGSVWVEAVLL